MACINMVSGWAFVAGALYIASHYMKTMVPLRLCEIAANMLFVAYGWLYPSYPRWRSTRS